MNQPVRRGRLPIGVQTFRKVRTNNRYYVDKTDFAMSLIDEDEHYFLARPRRFGKSLFVSMLKELFEGKRDLFQGLAAYRKWNWSVCRPVLVLDLSNVNASLAGDVETDVSEQLHLMEQNNGVSRLYDSARGRLRYLIRTLHERSGKRVALLVDEYDKPIVDALHNPNLARKNRDYLRSLYSVVKSCDASLRFSLLTGVTKFSKVSLFSSLNNLNDITLDPRYSSICGYTERDLDTVFAPELDGLDRQEIRQWYNGYSWGGDEKVYNPYDILLLFRKREFQDYWFQTGTPRFLPDTLVRRGVSTLKLESLEADEALLSAFDIESVSIQAVLFQTGYLTVAEVLRGQHGQRSYRLGYPNREVRVSLNRSLLSSLVPGLADERFEFCRGVARHISAANFESMKQSLRAFFASIPHAWHRRNDIQRYEGYYASVFFALLSGFGLDTRPEEASSAGNLDVAVFTPDRIILFEFKVIRGNRSGDALRQLRAKGYAQKHCASGKPVHLVGIEFSTETRNVALVQWETACP